MSPVRRMTLGLLLSAVALTGAPGMAAAASAPPLHGVNLPNLTFQTTPAGLDAQMANAARVGANMVRVDVNWASLQPVGPGQYDAGYLGLLDRLVADAVARGIRPLLMVLRSPCWASSSPGAPARCEDFIRYGPRDPRAYAAVLHGLAARYLHKLAGFEIWNEPNHEGQYYFAGPDKPARYAALLRAAYPAIKSAAPHMLVAGGSLVGEGAGFLDALYAAGISGSYDVLAFHPYDSTLSALRDIRSDMARHRDRSPIWLTEFGWPSCYPAQKVEGGGHTCVTPAVQAQDFGDLFSALGRVPSVQAATLYNLYDKRSEDFGLIDKSGADKPSFAVVRRAFTQPLAPLPRPQLSVRGRVASGSIPAADYGTLTAYAGRSIVWKVTFYPDRFNRFRISLPAGLSRGRHRLVLAHLSDPLTASVNVG